MNNFNFCVGTEILFGKGQEENLAAVVSKYGTRVLLTYGGGSVKKTGLYDKVMKQLEGFEVYELNGIEPNPRVESATKGANLCKEHQIDVVLAVGGGSTIDCSKLIAAAACYEGEAWDLVVDASKIKKALPLCTVLTLSATGTEMDTFAVITNLATNEKLGFGSAHCLPKASILNPENTFTVPKSQTAAGSIDIFSHIIEAYFGKESVFVPDRFSEGLLKAVIKYAPIAIQTPGDYEARAQLMWASSTAINGLCSTGKDCAWSCHPMEHELSAFYDITHGVGLAILTPRWMEYTLSDDTLDKFVEYAINVWNLGTVEEVTTASYDRKWELAKASIQKTYDFFASLGVPMTLTELGIDKTHFEEMAEHAVEIGGLEYAFVALNKEDVVNIYDMCL